MSESVRNRCADEKMTCVIASQKPWQNSMAKSLRNKTGHEFVQVVDPEQFNVASLSAINPRYVFLPHWSHRVRSTIYERFECIIFHMTDVPFGRGGSPLQNLISRGIYETKISAIRCVEELDAGPVYLKRALSLHGSAEEIFVRASAIMEEMIVEIVDREPEPRDQDGAITVFKRRTPEQSDLATARCLDEVFDTIRMLDAEGYPRAFLDVGPLRLEFSRAARKVDRVLADVQISLPAASKRDETKQ